MTLGKKILRLKPKSIYATWHYGVPKQRLSLQLYLADRENVINTNYSLVQQSLLPMSCGTWTMMMIPEKLPFLYTLIYPSESRVTILYNVNWFVLIGICLPFSCCWCLLGIVSLLVVADAFCSGLEATLEKYGGIVRTEPFKVTPPRDFNGMLGNFWFTFYILELPLNNVPLSIYRQTSYSANTFPKSFQLTLCWFVESTPLSTHLAKQGIPIRNRKYATSYQK